MGYVFPSDKGRILQEMALGGGKIVGKNPQTNEDELVIPKQQEVNFDVVRNDP